MAKKDSIDKFIKFNQMLEKRVKSPKDKDMNPIEFKTLGEISEFISTGSYILNAQLSGSLFGGAPNARSMELAGVSGSGKTFLMLNLAKNMVDMGYFVYFIDSEGGLEAVDFERFNINFEKIELVKTVKTFSQTKFFINQLIEMKKDPEFEDQKVAVMLDSYGMLNTDKEIKDSLAGKSAQDMGLRAKEGRQLFKTITLDLSNLQIPFIFSNHTSESIDIFKPGLVIGGGGGPLYAASVILKMDKKTLKGDDGKTKTGVIVTSETEKNRLAKPLKVQFHISFHKGMNPYVGLEQFTSWEDCGVEKGKLYKKDEYDKIVSKSTQEAKTLKSRTAEFFNKNGEDYVAVLYDTARNFIVRDTLQEVDKKDFFTKKIFTENVLKELDDNIIQPTFRYKSIKEIEEDELNDLDIDNESENEVVDEVED